MASLRSGGGGSFLWGEIEIERVREFEMERLRDEEMERCVGVVIRRRPWSFLIQALPRWF